jgi:hypothetical protein
MLSNITYLSIGRLPARRCVTALIAALVPAAYADEPLPELSNKSANAPLHYGPFDLFPSVRAGATYDDNIYIQSANKTDDFILSVAPGVVIGLGDYREKVGSFGSLEYSPNFLLYTLNSRNNAIDQEGRLKLEYKPGPWSIALEQGLRDYSGPEIDVGNRATRRLYNTAIGVQYEISPKTIVGVDATQLINDYESKFNSWNEWTVGGWADYWVTPKIKLGAGLNGGWVDVHNSANQHYEQALLRAAYIATEKVDFRASAGVEWRHFDSGRDAHVNGVFALGATYKPVEKTQVRLDLYRRNQSSVVLQDQDYTTTGFAVGLRQSMSDRFIVGVSGGYDHLSYFATANTVTGPKRVDDYFFVRPNVEWTFNEHLSAGAFYQYRKNDSKGSSFNFSNNQVGLSSTYSF